MQLEPNLHNDFHEHGWCIVRNVFTPAEIEEFRSAAIELAKTGYKGDLFSSDILSRVLTDKRVISIARELLHNDPVYFGDSSISYNQYNLGFHKDNPDRDSGQGPDWRSNYNVIRFGLYLQDCDEHSGGLTLRDKSHHTNKVNVGRIVNARTRTGDLLAWKHTTTHSGNARIPKLFDKVTIHPHISQFIPLLFFKPYEKERVALFFTMGAEGQHLSRAIEYFKSRHYGLEIWQHSAYKPEILEHARKQGLKVLDYTEMARTLDINKANVQHQDLPWQDNNQ